MFIDTAKTAAINAGLKFEYSPKRRAWGLSDPAHIAETLWISRPSVASMSDTTFRTLFIDDMVESISEYTR